MHRSILLSTLIIGFFLQLGNGQDVDCVRQETYEYITYTGKHRSVKIPVTCDSLVSMEAIQHYLDYGDIFYERAEKFFGWEFIWPPSLVTTVNPSLLGGGTGRDGTGSGLGLFGIDVDGFDTPLNFASYGMEGLVVHEGIHRWDFRGNNYFVGPDIAHPLNVVVDHILSYEMEGGHMGQYTDIAPVVYKQLEMKRRHKYYWRRYLSDSTLNWEHYFGHNYNFEELDKLVKPEAFERLAIQGATLQSIYFMYGKEGLKKIFDQIEYERNHDPTWQQDAIAEPNVARERFIRIFGTALNEDVTPLFEYWKYPMSDNLRAFLATLPANSKIQDKDGDGYSPLLDDYDDNDINSYPNAPEKTTIRTGSSTNLSCPILTMIYPGKVQV